jgi:hypothetical protein
MRVVLGFLLLASAVHCWLPMKPIRAGLSSQSTSAVMIKSSLSATKQSPKAPVPNTPVPNTPVGGIEPKYLAALGVFLAACLFDFFRMHGGVAPWQEGGFL